jgi:hypothetical protein
VCDKNGNPSIIGACICNIRHNDRHKNYLGYAEILSRTRKKYEEINDGL